MRILTSRTISAWPNPSALIEALGAEVVKQKAAQGDGEAQFSQGCLLVSRADGNVGDLLGASGRSPVADVGLAPPTYSYELVMAVKGGEKY